MTRPDARLIRANYDFGSGPLSYLIPQDGEMAAIGFPEGKAAVQVAFEGWNGLLQESIKLVRDKAEVARDKAQVVQMKAQVEEYSKTGKEFDVIAKQLLDAIEALRQDRGNMKLLSSIQSLLKEFSIKKSALNEYFKNGIASQQAEDSTNQLYAKIVELYNVTQLMPAAR